MGLHATTAAPTAKPTRAEPESCPKPPPEQAKPAPQKVAAAVPAGANSQPSATGLRAVLQSKPVAAVVQRAREAGLYRQPIPNNQDGQNNAQPGLGGKFRDAMPPYVFSPRRQTDQMVRQAYQLLPEGLTRNVAFVHAQRVAQDPEAAVRFMHGKSEVVIVGSFKGVNKATSEGDKEARDAAAVHPKEMKALEITLELARAMNVHVRDVEYGMGDSSPIERNHRFVPNAFATAKKAQLEARMQAVLGEHGLRAPERLSWGADELMLTAFAAQLPRQTVSLNLQSPNSRFFYDSHATTSQLAAQAAHKAGLDIAPRGAPADIHLHAFSLLPEADRAGDQIYPDRQEFALQHRADLAFARRIQTLDRATLARSVIVDARLNNGAMDTTSLPPTTDVLGYSAWGSGGNNFGQALAMAKIVAAAQTRADASGQQQQIRHVNAARRQLVAESIAHDAFFIGYASGASGVNTPARMANPLSAWLAASGLPCAPGDKLDNEQLAALYSRASAYASQRLQSKYGGLGGEIRFVPQPFNRRFDAATLFSRPQLPEAGSISSELLERRPELDPRRIYPGNVPDPQTGDQAVGSNGHFFDTRPPWWQRILNPWLW
jgi:hypothetical protein